MVLKEPFVKVSLLANLNPETVDDILLFLSGLLRIFGNEFPYKIIDSTDRNRFSSEMKADKNGEYELDCLVQRIIGCLRVASLRKGRGIACQMAHSISNPF
jgi:hypothetical protein